MTIFDKISNTLQEIEDAREELIFLGLKATAPKSGEITGMPKDGSNAGSPIEQHLINKEKLMKRIAALLSKFESQWKKAVYLMNAAQIDEQTKTMMFLRFYKGMQWKKCAAEMNKKYPNCKWNENKCFRKYREALYKIRQIPQN